MTSKPIITMEGNQALNLVKIHPIKCGLVYHRTRQLQLWMFTHDQLADLDGRKDLEINCDAPLKSLGDVCSFIDSFMAHVLVKDRELALTIDGERYVISKEYKGETYYLRVHYDVQNGRSWVRQCHRGWLFQLVPFGMFDTLLEGMLSDNWSSLPTENMVNE